METTVPECLDCGRCCFTTLPTAIRVTGDDHARLGDAAERYAVFFGNRCYMRVDEDRGHCAALRLDSETRQFVCSVYEIRPEVCRDLARGGRACAAERHEKSDRPDVLVARLHDLRAFPGS